MAEQCRFGLEWAPYRPNSFSPLPPLKGSPRIYFSRSHWHLLRENLALARPCTGAGDRRGWYVRGRSSEVLGVKFAGLALDQSYGAKCTRYGCCMGILGLGPRCRGALGCSESNEKIISTWGKINACCGLQIVFAAVQCSAVENRPKFRNYLLKFLTRSFKLYRE